MEKLPKYLKRREAQRLRDAVRRSGKARDIALFELLLRYGPRASEIGMLKLSNLDLDEGTIMIPRLKHGKMNVWPLFADVKTTMQAWLEERDSVTSWVFPGRKLRGLSRKTVYYMMKKYGMEANLPKEKCHPHVCRHFAAVNALEAGLEIHDVQDLLGHRTITSTMIYAQVSSKRRKKVARMLEDHTRRENQ